MPLSSESFVGASDYYRRSRGSSSKTSSTSLTSPYESPEAWSNAAKANVLSPNAIHTPWIDYLNWDIPNVCPSGESNLYEYGLPSESNEFLLFPTLSPPFTQHNLDSGAYASFETSSTLSAPFVTTSSTAALTAESPHMIPDDMVSAEQVQAPSGFVPGYSSKPPARVRVSDAASLNLPVWQSMEEAKSFSAETDEDEAAAPENELLQARKTENKKKTAHSAVEKRYRSNLNAKMAELKECIPHLRTDQPHLPNSNPSPIEDLEMMQNNSPMKKMTVLTDAAQYIKSLEIQRNYLGQKLELSERRNKVLQTIALSKRTMSDVTLPDSMGVPTGRDTANQAANEPHAPLPKRRKRNSKGDKTDNNGISPSAVSPSSLVVDQHEDKPATLAQGFGFRGGGLTRLLMGGLAGVTIYDGWTQDEANGRGLFALPVDLFRHVQWSTSLLGQLHPGRSLSTHHFLPILKIVLALSMLIQLLFLSFGVRVADHDGQKTHQASIVPLYSLASPLNERRRAWLTSLQSVWVPLHGFSEMSALVVKSGQLFLRKVLGWKRYAFMTGTSENDELSRIKAWDIAIDAQLAGGDFEASGTRLLLTFLASLTLPDTPARLLLKALHVQIIKQSLERTMILKWCGSIALADKFTDYFWRKARTSQYFDRGARIERHVDIPVDPLSTSSIHLLQQPCREIFTPAVTQRAYCLALNINLGSAHVVADEGLDRVIQDMEIRSPIDALAAWWSSLCLRRALLNTLQAVDPGYCAPSVEEDILHALNSAPAGSIAETRALAALAAFCEKNRRASIACALMTLPIGERGKKDAGKQCFPVVIQPNMDIVCSTSIRVAMRCAMILECKSRTPVTPTAALVSSLCVSIDDDDISLLGFAAAYHCLRNCVVAQEEETFHALPPEIRNLAARLRALVGGAWSNFSQRHSIPKEIIGSCVERCRAICKEEDFSDSDDDAGNARK